MIPTKSKIMAMALPRVRVLHGCMMPGHRVFPSRVAEDDGWHSIPRLKALKPKATPIGLPLRGYLEVVPLGSYLGLGSGWMGELASLAPLSEP
jgi:hypothetical protein